MQPRRAERLVGEGMGAEWFAKNWAGSAEFVIKNARKKMGGIDTKQ